MLIADAPIVLLDEPAAGLDVSGRRELLRLVRGFAAEGRAVPGYFPHFYPELEELADRFGIIQKGQWTPVREGQIFFTRDELRAGFTQNHWTLECSELAAACTLLGPEESRARSRHRPHSPDRFASRRSAGLMIEQLVRAGHKIYHFEAAGRSLDDVALHAMQKESTP